jgi:hypothetical protein
MDLELFSTGRNGCGDGERAAMRRLGRNHVSSSTMRPVNRPSFGIESSSAAGRQEEFSNQTALSALFDPALDFGGGLLILSALMSVLCGPIV